MSQVPISPAGSASVRHLLDQRHELDRLIGREAPPVEEPVTRGELSAKVKTRISRGLRRRWVKRHGEQQKYPDEQAAA